MTGMSLPGVRSAYVSPRGPTVSLAEFAPNISGYPRGRAGRGDRAFTYYTPARSTSREAKVRVPFGRAKADGFELGESDAKPPFDIKPIEDIYDLSFMPPSVSLTSRCFGATLLVPQPRHHVAPVSACCAEKERCPNPQRGRAPCRPSPPNVKG